MLRIWRWAWVTSRWQNKLSREMHRSAHACLRLCVFYSLPSLPARCSRVMMTRALAGSRRLWMRRMRYASAAAAVYHEPHAI
jgi:hypothetical protein